MDRLEQLLVRTPFKELTERSADGGRITVSFGLGPRNQAVEIQNVKGIYVFTAVIAGKRRAAPNRKRRRQTAMLAWHRNSYSDLVTFGLDRRDRLIGRIRHPSDHLDLKELELYLKSLATECDRMEYLLTGLDRF